MIICDREEANKLIKEESNLFKDDERNKDIVSEYIDYETKEIKRGRNLNDKNIEEERRKEIATLAIASGLSKEEVSKLTEVSISQVGAYKAGATSSASYDRREGSPLMEHVTEVRSEITSRAQNKLLAAIEALTDGKIQTAKAKDISAIAKDMSQVIRNTNPDNSGGNFINQKVLIYAPRGREEHDFKTIEVDE